MAPPSDKIAVEIVHHFADAGGAEQGVVAAGALGVQYFPPRPVAGGAEVLVEKRAEELAAEAESHARRGGPGQQPVEPPGVFEVELPRLAVMEVEIRIEEDSCPVGALAAHARQPTRIGLVPGQVDGADGQGSVGEFAAAEDRNLAARGGAPAEVLAHGQVGRAVAGLQILTGGADADHARAGFGQLEARPLRASRRVTVAKDHRPPTITSLLRPGKTHAPTRRAHGLGLAAAGGDEIPAVERGNRPLLPRGQGELRIDAKVGGTKRAGDGLRKVQGEFQQLARARAPLDAADRADEVLILRGAILLGRRPGGPERGGHSRSSGHRGAAHKRDGGNSGCRAPCLRVRRRVSLARRSCPSQRRSIAAIAFSAAFASVASLSSASFFSAGRASLAAGPIFFKA